MLDIYIATENFVFKHKTKLLVGALAVTSTLTALMMIGTRDWDRFLKEHPDIRELYFDETN